MTTLIVIIVLLLLFGGGGYWGYRAGHYGGTGLGGILGLLLLVLVLYLVLGGGKCAAAWCLEGAAVRRGD